MLIESQNLIFNNVIRYPDIKIEPGQITFLCGESGSGKSTFLKLITGVVSPSGGSLIVEGSDSIDLDTVELRRRFLLVSQSVYLFEGTIRQNFEKFYQYRELAIPNELEMHRFLELCCADFSLDATCTSMSGGERQRVFLAIFLSFGPQVIMLDEPTSALDPSTSSQLMENLTAFCKEREASMIVVSHDHSLAERFADKVIELRGGRSK